MTDFTVFAGDVKTLNYTVTDDAGDVVDLTSVTSIRWQLAKAVSKAALITKAVGSGVTVIDAENGRFDVALLAADTEALKGDYYHEAEIVDALGRPATIDTGIATINPTLIKPA